MGETQLRVGAADREGELGESGGNGDSRERRKREQAGGRSHRGLDKWEQKEKRENNHEIRIIKNNKNGNGGGKTKEENERRRTVSKKKRKKNRMEPRAAGEGQLEIAEGPSEPSSGQSSMQGRAPLGFSWSVQSGAPRLFFTRPRSWKE